jgi:hypothetical protein
MNIQPNIIVNTNLPGWHDDIEITPIQIKVNGRNKPAFQIDVTLRRLLSVRILTVLLLLILVGFITFLPFVKETGSAIELSLGIFFGLWGIQDVLIPGDIEYTTLIHSLLMMLYTYLAVAAVIRFVSIPMLKQAREI